MQAQICVAAAGPCGDGPPSLAAGRPGSSCHEVSGDPWQAAQTQSAEEFLGRFEDAIDDRVADILDERDALRARARPRPGFAAIALSLAVIATILLRHTPVAACAVWLSTAIVCLAVRTSKPRKP